MSTVNETDLLLVERNGVQYQITYNEMSTLNDDDLLLVERSGVQYKVEAQYVSSANGIIVPEVEVLTPLDRAGDPELTYLKSDTILAVEDDGGTLTQETDTISSTALDRWVDNGLVSYDGTSGGATVPTAEEVNRIFDGSWSYSVSSSSDYWLINGLATVDNLVILTFNPSIPYTSKVEVLHYRSGIDQSQTISYKAGINGSLQTHALSPDPVNWYEIASGSGSMTTLSFGGSYFQDRTFQSIRAIRVDGVELRNPQILSFPTSNNFDKFAVGDVAQNPGVQYETSVAPQEVTADPFSTVNSLIRASAGASTSIKFIYPAPVDFSGIRRWRGGSYTAGQSFIITWEDQNGVTSTTTGTTTTNYASAALASDPPNLVKAFTITGDDGYAFQGWEDVSSVFVPTGQLDEPVLITDIDADATPNPTITVDGGTLTTSDNLSKTVSYATKLTLAGDTDLAQMALGPAVMTDGVLGGSGYTQTPYTLTTTTIDSVSDYPDQPFFQDIASIINSPLNGSDYSQMFDGDDNTYGVLFNKGVLDMRYTIAQYPTTFSVPVPILTGQTLEIKAALATGGGDVANNHRLYLKDADGNNLVTCGNGTTVQTFTASVDTDLVGWVYDINPEIGSTNAHVFIYYIKVDDQYLIQNNNLVLSFPGDVSTNPDLRYFEAGDEVQSEWNQAEVWSDDCTATPLGSSDTTALFDGNLSSSIGSGGGAGSTFTITLPSSLNSGNLVAYVYSIYSAEFSLNGSAYVTCPSSLGAATTSLPLQDGPNTLVVRGTGANSATLSGITVDGVLLVDQGIVGTSATKVISTDLAANTMTVDGGTWYALETFDFDHTTDITQLGSPTTFLTEGYSSPDDTLAGRFGPAVGDGAELNFNPPIAVTTQVSLNCSSATGVVEISINDGAATGVYPTTRSLVNIPFTGNVNKIRLERTSGIDAAYCDGIFFDGVRLVDQAYESNTYPSTTLPGGTGDLVDIDADNNAVYLTAGDRAWIPANNFAGTNFALAAGSIANPPAPDYLAVTFTSLNAGTTPFTGIDATLSSRTWTLETGPDKTGPWTLVSTYEDFDMLASQDGATPWTTGKPVLNQSTWYRVKVAYNSTTVETPVESDYHTFKTGV